MKNREEFQIELQRIGKIRFRMEKKDFRKISTQLKQYADGKRHFFDTSLEMDGTVFEKAVWEEIQKIPYGEVRTYKQVAQALGKPKAARAVGNALGKNPLPIVVPCHRVIASHGLGGYTGGLSIKKKLLQLEAGQQHLDLY